jgi:hypothetical protein
MKPDSILFVLRAKCLFIVVKVKKGNPSLLKDGFLFFTLQQNFETWQRKG